MRQIFLDRGEVRIKNVVHPQVEPHTVLVAVHYALVGSGQECAAIAKGQPTFLETIPRKVKKVLSCVISPSLEDAANAIQENRAQQYSTLGSSCTGRVIATGSLVKTVRVGDWVACFGQEYAYYADVVCVPEHCLVKLPNKNILKVSALTAYGARAMHMIHKASLALGEIVAVVIHDLLGILVAHLCVKNGAQVIGICATIELFDQAQRCGVQHLFLMNDSSLVQSLEFITGNSGVDIVFIPSLSIHQLLFDPACIVCRKGRIVVGCESSSLINFSLVLHKEVQLFFASTYGAGTDESCYERGSDYPIAHVRWTEQRNAQAFVRLISDGQISQDLYAFPEYDIEELACKKNIKSEGPLLGIYLKYISGQTDTREFKISLAVKDSGPLESVSVPSFFPARKSSFNIGIVGAPKLGKPYFFDDLLSLRAARIVAISDEDTTDAVNLGYKCGVEHIYNSVDDMLSNESIDVVMVNSTYAKRASNTLKALQQGKAVYVEKPFITTFDDLALIDNFFTKNSMVPLCVDNYRLHSCLIMRIREITDNRKAPMIINYRMNVGGISKEELIQRDRGSGRIINDAAHIMHLFCALTGAEPTTVSVEALHGVTYNLFPTENFVVAVNFSDGSLCNLTYTVLGNVAMGTERMEIFVDGKSIILDDYIGLYGFGTPSWFNTTLATQDKGHKALLKLFFKGLKRDDNSASLFSWNDIMQSTRLTLIIDQLACQGGGTNQRI